jgi:hypothetical protein
VEPSLFGQFTGVKTVVSKSSRDGWVYLLRSEQTQTYETLEENLLKLSSHLCMGSELFRVIGPEGDFIVLSGNHALMKEVVDTNGSFCEGVNVWQTKPNPLPPRKRAIPPETSNDIKVRHTETPYKPENPQQLIPGFKRLSRQLQVNFSTNVHGSEGKRRREPVRSIYEEAAIEIATKKKRPYVRKITPITTDDSSEMEENEITHELKNKSKTSEVLSALAQAMDAITQAHGQAMNSKDETIRALKATTQAIKDTIKAQTALIVELLARV